MTETPCQILYCHAATDTGAVSAGDWFFHTGQWAQCAQAWPTGDGGWDLCVDFEVADKPLPEREWHFASLEDCKAFVADYFEGCIEEIDPADFPGPDL
jgi:hypothetical protein